MVSVVHLSTYDAMGGAAIAASRLHEALRDAGVTSSMMVNGRSGDDPDTRGCYRQDLRARMLRSIGHELRERERRRYAARRPAGSEAFSDDRAPGPDPFERGLPEADVFNLHWIADFLDYRRFFGRTPDAKPLVWTLHDMNPFTGGCHYAMECDAFTEACGACPQLGSDEHDDWSRRIFARKRRALAGRRPEATRIVAPSAWLAKEARKSALFGRFDVDVIPNGLDVDSFRPRPRAAAREVFGLPADRPVVLFASDTLANRRKGFDLLLEALSGLPPNRPAALAALGATGSSRQLPGGAIPLGRLSGTRLISFAYSAADLFVLPTRADNLPNVVAEAMACGVPVVAFDVGGLRDMVREGETGLLVPPEDVDALRRAIVTLIEDPERRARMSERSREIATKTYAADVQAARYTALYEGLVS